MLNSSHTISLEDFEVYITSLGRDSTVPLLVGIPTGFGIPGTPNGINTYRANAVKKGIIEFKESGIVPFQRTRGESPQTARIAIAGDYWLTGKDDENEFVCIISKHHRHKFYDYTTAMLQPGESITVAENLTGERNVFLFEGKLTTGTSEFEGFKHLRMSQPREYVFTNTGDTEVFMIYMWEIGLAAAQDLVRLHFPDDTDAFVIME